MLSKSNTKYLASFKLLRKIVVLFLFVSPTRVSFNSALNNYVIQIFLLTFQCEAVKLVKVSDHRVARLMRCV
jgi:hypothetical protein